MHCPPLFLCQYNPSRTGFQGQRNVYKNDKEYAFKRMQRRIKQMRDIYKYTGQKIESELLTEIDRLIKEKS